MRRNIKVLFNFEPPATEAEFHASALQFVRKISGTTQPSKANEEAFQRAVDKVEAAARELLGTLTTAPPKTGRSRQPRPSNARQSDSEANY